MFKLSLFSESNLDKFKNLFGINDFDMFFYIIVLTFYSLIFKVIKDALVRLNDTKKINVEVMITHYIEIDNTATTILQSSALSEQVSSFYSVVRNSFNFIEYPVYTKIRDILENSSLNDNDKIREIQAIAKSRSNELIREKNRYLDYSFSFSLIPDIKKVSNEFRHIFSAAAISLLILYLFLVLIYITLLQPNGFEMIITVIFSILFGFSVFLFVENYKILWKKKWDMIVFSILMISMLFAMLLNSLALYIDLIVFVLILSIKSIALAYKN